MTFHSADDLLETIRLVEYALKDGDTESALEIVELTLDEEKRAARERSDWSTADLDDDHRRRRGHEGRWTA